MPNLPKAGGDPAKPNKFQPAGAAGAPPNR